MNFSNVGLKAADPVFQQFLKMLPSLAGEEAAAGRTNQQGVRMAQARDARGTGMLGFQPVSQAFSGGTRTIQGLRDLQNQIRLMRQGRSQQIGEGFFQSLNSAPVQASLQDALRRAAEPSTFGRLAGIVGGGALNIFGPALAGKIAGNPLTSLFGQGGGGGSRSPVSVGGMQFNTGNLDELRRQTDVMKQILGLG